MTSGGIPPWPANQLDRRQVLKALAIGGAAAAFPGALAACGSSATSSQPGKVSTKNITSLTWGLPTSTIVGLDIASAFDGVSQEVQIVGLEGLLAVSNQLTLMPLLATSWTYDPSALKYVFQIRQGVKFWDGTPMTPDDVVFSLTRHIDPKVSSQISTFFVNVTSYSVTGTNEVTMHLKQPDPLVQHALPFAGILSKAFAQKVGSALGKPGSSVNIMGTGPFKVTSFSSNTAATVERNPGYWGARPVVEKCSFTCISDPQTMMLALQSGSVSGTFDVPVQQAANWAKISTIRTYSAPGMFVSFLSFDMSAPPWNDIHARKAIAYAADRSGFVKAFLAGNGTPAACVVPPEQWGSVQDPAQVNKLYASLPDYPFNLEMARKELAQSAYPHGFTTNNVLVPSDFPFLVKTMESLSIAVKPLGINMPVQQVPSNDWLANLYGHKNLGVCAILFTPDYADPADYMIALYPSANATKNNFNLANFKDPQVDKLLQQANAASSNSQRAQYLGEVLKISQQELPYYALYWQDKVMAIQNTYVYEHFTGLYYNQNWLTHVFSAT